MYTIRPQAVMKHCQLHGSLEAKAWSYAQTNPTSFLSGTPPQSLRCLIVEDKQPRRQHIDADRQLESKPESVKC